MLKILTRIFLIFLFFVISTTSCFAVDAIWKWENTKGITVYIPDYENTQFPCQMRDAFEYWSNLSNRKFTFKYVRNSDAQIKVKFVEYFDEDILGYATPRQLKPELKIDIVVAEKMPNDSNPVGMNKMIKVMRHEIGHALGLPHSENQNSIMYPSAPKIRSNTDLMYDKKNLYDIYGWK